MRPLSSASARSDFISGLAFFALGAFAILESGSFPASAQVFPRGVAGVMMGCAALLALRGLFFGKDHELSSDVTIDELSPHGLRRVLIAIGLTIVYVLSIASVGFVTASLVFIPVSCFVLGLRRPVLVLATTVAFVFGTRFVLETYLGIRFPHDLLFAWL